MSITITHSRADFRFLLNDRHLQERNGNLNRKIKYEKIQRYIVTGIACTAFVWFCDVEMIYDLEDICPESSNTVHT